MTLMCIHLKTKQHQKFELTHLLCCLFYQTLRPKQKDVVYTLSCRPKSFQKIWLSPYQTVIINKKGSFS